MIDNVAVGKTIAKLRQSKNMTQQQLAAALNVSHQAVSKWETGAALPDVQTLVALTQLFGVTLEQLLNADVPQDRVEPSKSASSFDESIQNIGNFVNNIVGSIFRPEKKDAEDDGAQDPEITQEGEGAADGAVDGEGTQPDGAESFDAQTLLQMAPFMSKGAVDELLLENRDKLTAADIARFAPFASQECLEQLIKNDSMELDWEVLRRIAPFLKRETVDELAKNAAKSGYFVKRTAGQNGINAEDIGRVVQDMGQKLGAGVEKALRKASKLGNEVMGEVTSALGGIVDSVKERQAKADALRRAACERALQDEKWDWLAEHIPEIKDEELLRQIAQKANGLGMHDWVLEHLNGYADTRTIDAAIEAGNWGWLGDHAWQFEDELQEKIALAAAKQENWQWLSTYAEQISLENCADEIGIAAYKSEARVLASQLAHHCMNDEQRQRLADEVVAAEDYDFLQQLVDILPASYIGGMLVAEAEAKQWDRLSLFIANADVDSVDRLMELAIAEGNFDVIDVLDEYL